MRVGRDKRYVPAEDLPKQLSPAEELLVATGDLPADDMPLTAPGDEDPVFPPWEPTGDETPRKTIELERESARDTTVPPPETAGGSIPAAYTWINRFGPSEE